MGQLATIELFLCVVAVSRVMDSDDSDVMTDVFATLFGKRSVVGS